MNKKIEFEDNGQKYVLEYNRESIQMLERQGFNVNEFTDKPMTMLPLAFEGLFYKNHKYVKKAFVDECFDRFKNKSALIETIAEMINETYETLTDDSVENDKGNIEWKIV